MFFVEDSFMADMLDMKLAGYYYGIIGSVGPVEFY